MTKRELPAAFYAAAGAGDLAYQRLRKLPETANRTLRAAGQTATALRERAAAGTLRINRDRLTVDLATLRQSAQRGASAVKTRAAAVQERAITGYRHLVAHGERIMAARAGAGEVGRTVEIEPAPAATVSAEPAAAGPEQPAAPTQTTRPDTTAE